MCQVLGNTNAPPAVTYSAVIYCLRCMVGEDTPLNQGCLEPVRFTIPPGSLLNPSPEAAVVGGNVCTSQVCSPILSPPLPPSLDRPSLASPREAALTRLGSRPLRSPVPFRSYSMKSAGLRLPSPSASSPLPPAGSACLPGLPLPAFPGP